MKKHFSRLLLFALLPTSSLLHAEQTDSSFQTPSGNIHCLYMANLKPQTLRCDLAGGGDVAWNLSASGSAKKIEATDTIANPSASVLEYGKSFKFRSIICQSAPTGLTCLHEKTKHGFFLSKKQQKVF